MADNSQQYRTKELEERRLAALARDEAQVIHQLSADLYAELYRQVRERESGESERTGRRQIDRQASSDRLE